MVSCVYAGPAWKCAFPQIHQPARRLSSPQPIFKHQITNCKEIVPRWRETIRKSLSKRTRDRASGMRPHSIAFRAFTTCYQNVGMMSGSSLCLASAWPVSLQRRRGKFKVRHNNMLSKSFYRQSLCRTMAMNIFMRLLVIRYCQKSAVEKPMIEWNPSFTSPTMCTNVFRSHDPPPGNRADPRVSSNRASCI